MHDGDEIVPEQVLVGTYEVQRLLGRGAMGAVYCVRHVRTGGQLALKILNRDLATDPEMYRRFEDEARIISGLNHPNIVKLADWNIDEQGRPFLVMEFLDGEDLQLRLNRLRTLPVAQVMEIAQQVGGALQAAHDSDIIHRDVKPQNIFLVANRTGLGSLNLCKLLDFGVCKTRRSQSQATQNLTFIGTPEYMSPEAARGTNDALDGRSDQFSLAVVLYRALTGVSPFAGGDPVSVLYRVVHESAPPLAPLCDAPPGMVRAIEQALSKDKEHRFGSMHEFVQALLRTATGPDIATQQHVRLADSGVTATLILRPNNSQPEAEATPPSAQSSISGAAVEARPRRPRLMELSIAGVLVAALAGFALSRWPRHRGPERSVPLSATLQAPAVQAPAVQAPPPGSLPAGPDFAEVPIGPDAPLPPALITQPAGPREPAPPRKDPLTPAPAPAPAAPSTRPKLRAVPPPAPAETYPPFPLHKVDKAGLKDVQAFMRSRESDPSSPRGRYGRAFELYRKGDYGAAVGELQHAYRESRNPSLLLSIGHAALQNLQTLSAINAYDKYRKLVPSPDPELSSQTVQAKAMAASVEAGLKLLQKRQFCKAAQKFDLDCDPDTLPRVNLFMGQALKGCGRPEEARAAYLKLLKVERGAPESLRRLVSDALKELERSR